VRPYLQDALVSAINAAEVAAKLNERGMEAESVRAWIEGFKFTVMPFDSMAAYATGRLRMPTRRLGLSLGDRACLALALKEDVPVLTADRAWRELDLGIEIRVIR
jgi:PIN domain nuclease of toxin-antitoxin system